MAPPTAPLAAPTPAPTAVPVATRPAFPLPSSAPAPSASCRQASISYAAISFPTDCICALGYRTGCAVEQPASNSDPPMIDRSLCRMASPVPSDVYPALFMSASAAIDDPLLRRALGLRARSSDLHRTARVRIRSSGLHAPVARRGLAISRRTVMNKRAKVQPSHHQLHSGPFDEDTFVPSACTRMNPYRRSRNR